jgi:hypothetical protein
MDGREIEVRERFNFFTGFVSALDPPASYIMGNVGHHEPRREADNSLSTSVEVKNCGAIPPLRHMPSWLDA